MKQQDVNEISHRRFCRMNNNIRAQFGRQVHGTLRLTALNTFRRQCFLQIIKITWNGRY